MLPKLKGGMPLNEMHKNHFLFFKCECNLSYMNPRLVPFQAKPMQVLLLMQNANEHAIMQIFLYFPNKWMKIQNGITKHSSLAASTNT